MIGKSGPSVALAGAIGPATAPLLRAALERCLRDGMTAIDVDLATVGSCDAKRLGVFLTASERADRVHCCLRLRHPCAQIARLLAVTDSASLLSDPPGVSASADERQGDADRTSGPVAKDGIRLRRLTREQAKGRGEDIAGLAVEPATGLSAHAARQWDAFLDRLAVSARRPGFALLVAETTVLVGCAFGFPVGHGARFERGLQESVQRLTGCAPFVLLTQVVAHHHAQYRDIGRRLQQRLLADRHAALGVVLLHPADQAGQAAFESWGWRNYGEMVGLPGRGAPCLLVLFRKSGPGPRLGSPAQAGRSLGGTESMSGARSGWRRSRRATKDAAAWLPGRGSRDGLPHTARRRFTTERRAHDAAVARDLTPEASHSPLVAAWWPRCDALALELPALVGSLDPGHGTVTRVTVSAAAWPDAPQTVPAPDYVIEAVLSDAADEAHAINLECGTVGCGELLVVPPGEPVGTAGRLVTAASDCWNTLSAERVLARIESGVGQESARQRNG